MATVNVVTASQLDSIRSKVAEPQLTSKGKYLQELHKQSTRRAQQWPNTIEAQRERKARAQLERSAADEVVRQQVDREAAREQAAARRLVIERVNKMLFNETDKVKGFHGAVLHCDVLSERAAQIELKGQVRGLRAAQEEAFVRQQREQLELAEAAELAKMAEAKARALQQRDAQMAQLDELKASILAEREQNRLEGEMLREKAAQEAAELAKSEKEAQARAQQALWETTQANDALRAFKLKEAERERQADLAIEAYATKKAELFAERKRREDAAAAAKEARRKAMVELMETKFAEFMSNESERLERDVAQAEAKDAAEQAARARQRRDEWQSICRSRTQQLALRRARKEAALLADQKFMAAWQERTKELAQEEQERAAAARARNKHFASFQKHQVDVKARKKAAGALEALREAAMVEEMASDADERFTKYAQEYIDEYGRRGKPTKPMELQLSRKPPFASA